jgi:hypothetical protein
MMKGALVELIPAVNVAIPNVVLFQFNPETLRHTFSQPEPSAGPSGRTGSHPLASPGLPGETFSFSLSLDVTDQLADPDLSVQQAASDFGIYTRLSALEMLLYPTVNIELPTGGGANNRPAKRTTPTAQVPTVLFVWGTGRIVPVRITGLTITEKLSDAKLTPADAQIELRVLTPEEVRRIAKLPGTIAGSAYAYTQGFRVGQAVRAAAMLGDSARALVGILQSNVF